MRPVRMVATVVLVSLFLFPVIGFCDGIGGYYSYDGECPNGVAARQKDCEMMASAVMSGRLGMDLEILFTQMKLKALKDELFAANLARMKGFEPKALFPFIR